MKRTSTFLPTGVCLGRVTAILVACLCLLFLPLAARAQSATGLLEGTVTDIDGAVIANAHIRVVNERTRDVVNTTSNKVGFFQAPGLLTSTYRVVVDAPGMKTYVTSIELLVAQSAVINPVLTPGSATQRVVVNANSVQLTTTDSPVIQSTLENRRINQLPENGRELDTLLNATIPGLEGQRMNGMDPAAFVYDIDGTQAKDELNGELSTAKTALVDPDTVQEVQVKESNAGAQFSEPSAAIVSTKSGTDKIHGTAFETARNNAFGIAKSRQNPANFAAPHLVRNEFGVSAGGPVIIPHLYDGRRKTFWFFAYERFSLAQDNAALNTVPTAAMSQGDFSGLVNKKGILQTIYDPATTGASKNCAGSGGGTNMYCRTPFPNNQIPMSEQSPLAKLYYQLVPRPNTNANPLIQANLNSLNPSYEVVPQETIRLDQRFNQGNRGFIRFSHESTPVNEKGGPLNVAIPGYPQGVTLNYTNNNSVSDSAAIDYTHIFSPTLFSETILGMRWYNQTKVSGVDPNVDYETMLGLPNNFGEVGFPTVGGPLIENLTTSQNLNSEISQRSTNLDENLTKVIGRHQLLFGGSYEHKAMGDKPEGIADSVMFGADPTAIYNPSSKNNYNPEPNTGYADASFFLGSAGSYKTTLEPPFVHYHLDQIDAYLQDDYHVNKKLTLNLGLRYEAHPALYTNGGLANSFDLYHDAMVTALTPAQLIAKGYTTQAIITNDENIGVKFETPAEAGMPDNTLLNNYDLNFLPRFGVAWQPFSSFGTVLRGGFGSYLYDAPLEDYVNHPEQNNPFTAQYTQDYGSAAQATDGLPNELLRYNDPAKFGVAGRNTSGVVNSNSINSILPGVAQFSTSAYWKPVHVDETSFTIEQPLPGRSALRVSYLYIHTTNLNVMDSYNNHPTNYQYEMAYGVVPPTGGANVIGTNLQNTYAATATGPYDQTTWGPNTFQTSEGWANDNELQVNYQRLYHSGSAYQLSYIYSKALRMGGDSNPSNAVDPIANYPGVLGRLGTMTSPYGAFFPGGAPPPRPAGSPVWADYHALDKFQGYELDTNTPKLHIKFSGILDLPFGRGRRFFSNVSPWANELIGGFQLAGLGSIVSQSFSPGAGDWGPTNPIHTFKHKYPITDCRSGVCDKAYLWYNGYLAPTVTTDCTSNCVFGLPGNYKPVQTPIDNTPNTTYYGTNTVLVTLADGTQTTLQYDGGPSTDLLAKTFLNGPINWTADLSLFKVFPIKDGVFFRVNVDAFNAFNVQGENNPGLADGVQTFLASANTPRQLQFTARVTF